MTELDHNGSEPTTDREIESKSWEELGRDLLIGQAERTVLEVHTAVSQVKSRIAKGDSIRRRDVIDIDHSLEMLRYLSDTFAEVSDETGPAPHLHQFLDDDDRGEYMNAAWERGYLQTKPSTNEE
ncbi:MAG: hypothetical protein ABEJ67_02460 [Halanaeroarchaeum sp.]